MAELCLAFLSCLFLGWTWARESPWFWRQGYPEDWHWLTREYYHPILVILAVAIVARLAANFRLRRWRALLAAQVALFIFLASLALMVANNVENWLNDRPLHWHEGDFLDFSENDRVL